MTERETQIVILAQKVMGWKIYGVNPGELDGWQTSAVKCFDQPGWALARFTRPACATINWDPYADIADAWMLAAKLTEQAWRVTVQFPYTDQWHVCIQRTCDPLAKDSFHGHGATAHEAICTAVLRAIEVPA